MSEEERDILVTKRKYWTKLMKYNLTFTIFFGIGLFFLALLALTITDSCDGKASEVGLGCNLIFFPLLISWLWIFVSWPLMILMYGYQRFKIYKITKPKVLAKPSEMGLRSTQKHNGAMDEMKDKSYNSGDAGFVLLIIGLILMLFAHAMSLDNDGCISPDVSNQASMDDYQNCVEGLSQKVKDTATVSLLSSLSIFTGIGLMCRAILNNQKPPV